MTPVTNLTRITAADAEQDTEQLVFTSHLTSALTLRINCKVCDASTLIPIAGARLCFICRKDLPKTARHITERLQAAETYFRQYADRFDADLAHSDHQARLDKMLDAEDQPHFAERVQKTIAVNDDFAALVRSWQAMRDAYAAYRTVEGWAMAAEAELEAV